MEWCKLAAEGGNANALNDIGWYYYTGELKGAEEKIYLGLYRKSAQGGNVYGMRNIGVILLAEGKLEEAIYWLKRGAIRGSAECSLILGHCYNPLTCMATEKREEKAFKWYTHATLRKNVEAYFRLAEFHFYKGNYDICLDLCHKLKEVKPADKTHFHAEYFLGICYSLSKEFLDHNLARKWMTVAAEHGHVAAQKKLGEWYVSGKNFSSAAFWWQKAANQGDYESVVELATCTGREMVHTETGKSRSN